MAGLFIYLFVNVNGGLLLMYLFKWIAVIYLCIYLNGGCYLFTWQAYLFICLYK